MPNTPDTRNYPAYEELIKKAFADYSREEQNPYRKINVAISYQPEDIPTLATAVDDALIALELSLNEAQRRRALVLKRCYILEKPDDTYPDEPKITRPLSDVAATLLKNTSTNEPTSLLGVQKSRVAAIKRDGLNSVANLLYQDPYLSRFFRQID